MLYLQIASPKSSVLNFLDSNSFEVIISIFQRTEKVPDMERLLMVIEPGKYKVFKVLKFYPDPPVDTSQTMKQRSERL